MKKEPGWKIRMNTTIARLENTKAKIKKYLEGYTICEPLLYGHIDEVIKEVKRTNGQSSILVDQLERIDQYTALAKAAYDKRRKKAKEATS